VKLQALLQVVTVTSPIHDTRNRLGGAPTERRTIALKALALA
jgi:hypothetical protein